MGQVITAESAQTAWWAPALVASFKVALCSLPGAVYTLHARLADADWSYAQRCAAERLARLELSRERLAQNGR
jgi:hypothetical protein